MTTTEQIRAAIADRYVIERELGAGGMATVYLAADVKHDRKVALKVLRPELAAVIGAERFLAEIKTTANLQHPHILPLFDSGEAGSFLFYVMPYVAGESLRDRLRRETQLPVDEAVRITREVASALDYAHRHDVIHRDIKPENILLHDGQALVADFGIALAVSHAGGTRMTETGMSIGTPHYMSPEQAMGDKVLDARSDVYALGATLYELLVGEPPFTGPSAQAIIAKVVTEEPKLPSTFRRTVPPHVDMAVRDALQKLPADRWASAAEFAAALSGTAKTRTTSHAVPPALQGPWRQVALGAMAVALGLAGVLAWIGLRPSPAEPRALARFIITYPDSAAPLPATSAATAIAPGIAISPDGQSVVYVGNGVPETRLYRRRLDRIDVEPLPGTDGADTPFFSPDGRWLGYRQGNRLRKLDLLSGSSVTLGTLEGSSLIAGAVWGHNDTIYLGVEPGAGLQVVPGTGGTITPLAILETTDYVAPTSLLPNQEWLVLVRSLAGNTVQIEAVSLRDGTVRVLSRDGVYATYIGRGLMLLQNADGALLVTPVDPDDPRELGAPLPIGEYASASVSARTLPQIAVAENGTAAMVLRSEERNLLVERDAAGRERPLLEAARGYKDVRYSPDGRRVAFTIQDGIAGSLWVYDFASRTTTRLTFGSDELYPVWTPDGRRIAFTSRDSGLAGLWWTAADGSGQPEQLLSGNEVRFPSSFTPDGRTLFYRAIRSTGLDIFALPLDGDGQPVPILVTDFNEASPEMSPMGRWLAYVSDQSGRFEVYVRSYPEGGAQYQISAGGGAEPVWSPDGRTLYYRRGSAIVGARLEFGDAVRVMRRDSVWGGAFYENVRWPQFDVHPDGSRMMAVRLGPSQSQMMVALHWVDDLVRRAAGR